MRDKLTEHHKWNFYHSDNVNWTDVSHFSQLKNPATKDVLLEENDPRGYNINAWVINPGGIGSKVWSDSLVVWHGSRSSFAFGDGHAETWKWSNEILRIFQDLRDLSQGQRTPSTEDGIRDLERIQRTWPVPRGLYGNDP